MDINDWVFLLAIIDVYIDRIENPELIEQAKILKEKIVSGDLCK